MNDTPPKLLTRRDLVLLNITYSNTHMLYLERISAFPRRVYIGKQTVCWRCDEVNAWLNAKIAERDGGANV